MNEFRSVKFSRKHVNHIKNKEGLQRVIIKLSTPSSEDFCFIFHNMGYVDNLSMSVSIKIETTHILKMAVWITVENPYVFRKNVESIRVDEDGKEIKQSELRRRIYVRY